MDKVAANKTTIVTIGTIIVHLLFSLYDFQNNQDIKLTKGGITAYSIVQYAIPEVINIKIVSQTIENIGPKIGPNRMPLKIQNNNSILKLNGPLNIK